MIVHKNAVVSQDVVEEAFVCDLHACKGACCVEGDLGAPLEDAELKDLEHAYEVVEPYLSKESKKQIKKQGLYVLDEEGDFSTPTIKGKECVYAIYDEKGILKCGIEQAYLDGKTEFRKPVSCHLYPIRIDEVAGTFLVNYHRWSICAAACVNGEKLKVPVYKFAKDALVRKFGQEWYEEFCQLVEAQESASES